ncbi:MAG: adenosylmethionine decarboxylase [Pseudomonadota bacterium]
MALLSSTRNDNDVTGQKLVHHGTDYFQSDAGQTFAGTHLLLDFWGARRLTEPTFIDQTLRAAAHAAGATILHSHMHRFSPSDGVTGVVVLSESHITIHTWPEREFAAIDIFMCGGCKVRDAVPTLRNAFQPARIDVQTQRRGLVPTDNDESA